MCSHHGLLLGWVQPGHTARPHPVMQGAGVWQGIVWAFRLAEGHRGWAYDKEQHGPHLTSGHTASWAQLRSNRRWARCEPFGSLVRSDFGNHRLRYECACAAATECEPQFMPFPPSAGLPEGPGGALGAAEGISYLVILGTIAWSIYTKASDCGSSENPNCPARLCGDPHCLPNV